MSAIKLKDRQTVYVTAITNSVKNKVKQVGDPVSLHPKQAEAWVKSGKATVEPPAGTKKASK